MNMIVRHWNVAKVALAEDRALAKSRVERTQTDFLPAALEIIEKPVSPTARISFYLFGGGLVLALLWAVFGRLDVVASASGKIIPAGSVKLIQPSSAGVVRSILVRDGQAVRKGQALVELDPTETAADIAQAKSALQTALLEVARARAVLGALDGHGLHFSAPTGTPAEIAETQRSLASSEFAAISAAMSGRGADRSAASASRDEALTQARKLDETLPLIDEQLQAYEALLAKGFAAKLKVIELRRQRQVAIRDRDAALDTARRSEAELAGAGSGVALSRAEARSKVLQDLARSQAEARLRTEELVKSEQRSRLQRLVSPVDGTVAQLAIHTVGGVVEPAKPIMIIVPSRASLEAEVRLLNKDMGFVRIGQDVAVKIEAFPFTRYGTIPGQVVSISSDAIEDEKLGLVYPVRIKLKRMLISRESGRVRLTPGMSVTADVRTGERSIASYLLSPIDEARLEAGRER
ncbi:HlyD family type I secretion periplasmic adaptor subunit [Sphingopyxis macrogoltabida]|uniref:Membrane fusion protein (MFP) family protein n=1 Tax=Sphingopyxis macrogoltabida TaxID=33050 RepID=A0AAC8YYW5_SPHMC|nr:HlyD family type I secretion periplasmic adaptor subunit [Sphingopyxis macrogoltabida]ALJ13766.1 secretion protein HylD [Sphingopyxis macrogoltabida]AMU88793.1 secretion protein HylD [Sphingopyxis macrogoltabida]